MSFDPVSSPANTEVVFFDTEPETFPPNFSILLLASSLVYFSKLPVNTKVFPKNLSSPPKLMLA